MERVERPRVGWGLGDGVELPPQRATPQAETAATGVSAPGEIFRKPRVALAWRWGRIALWPFSYAPISFHPV